MQTLIEIRRASILQLYEDRDHWLGRSIEYHVYDDYYHTMSAELAVIKARKCVGLNIPASEPLNDWHSAWPFRSTLGRLQAKEITFMQARVLRLEGHFEESYNICMYIVKEDANVDPILIGVLCELRRFDDAFERLDNQSTTTSIKLALANAHLLRYIHTILEEQPIWQSLQTSKHLFQELSANQPTSTYYNKITHSSLLIGLAMIEHLQV